MTEQQNNPEEQPTPENGSRLLSVNDVPAVAVEPDLAPASSVVVELDPANQALADALRISFMILKLVMVFVVGLWPVYCRRLLSGGAEPAGC